MTSSECTISVFNTIDENTSFSVTIPGHWQTKPAEKTNDDLKKLFELRSQIGIEILVQQVRKKS